MELRHGPGGREPGGQGGDLLRQVHRHLRTPRQLDLRRQALARNCHDQIFYHSLYLEYLLTLSPELGPHYLLKVFTECVKT